MATADKAERQAKGVSKHNLVCTYLAHCRYSYSRLGTSQPSFFCPTEKEVWLPPVSSLHIRLKKIPQLLEQYVQILINWDGFRVIYSSMRLTISGLGGGRKLCSLRKKRKSQLTDFYGTVQYWTYIAFAGMTRGKQINVLVLNLGWRGNLTLSFTPFPARQPTLEEHCNKWQNVTPHREGFFYRYCKVSCMQESRRVHNSCQHILTSILQYCLG